MQNWQRSCYDRRHGGDRRRVHSLDYFAAGGCERRGGRAKRRRSRGERRHNWVRVGVYISAYCGWQLDSDGALNPEGQEPIIVIMG